MIPYRDTISCAHTPWMTWTLIVANFAGFLYSHYLPDDVQRNLYWEYGLVPARYAHPEWGEWIGFESSPFLPYLLSQFLHGGWMHLVLNMWLLWIFGDNVEDRMGAWRYLAFYLLCGLSSGLAQVVAAPDSLIPVIGASGAIAGAMGAYLLLYPYARIVIWVPILFLPLFFQAPAIAFIGFWVIIQISRATLSLQEGYSEVAWWGHLGGFLAGMLLYRAFLARERNPPPEV